MLERCASGEIKSVRELEAEISQLKESIPVPTTTSASKGGKTTTTDVEAQVQPEAEKAQEPSEPQPGPNQGGSKPQTPEEISKAWKTGKLKDIDPDLDQLLDEL